MAGLGLGQLIIGQLPDAVGARGRVEERARHALS